MFFFKICLGIFINSFALNSLIWIRYPNGLETKTVALFKTQLKKWK